ncbi:MAG: cyclic nucleotide-binding domain-containing protein [Gammaproteobacteria bacterium SHHR-1]|uniref:cyclic nucleotide-binding domain-containing protein n=1 Tax=Magnetovirga frankeli TaxID=947516 RepID=UPI001293568C|nr:cyclic nucleotide-binding domain-containing protein [gamma proteobacterium SS-5]
MPTDPSQLRRLVPLTDLDRVGLERVAEIAQPLDLRRNQQIYAVDSKDSYVYYLLEGEIVMIDRNGREARLSADSQQARFAFGNLKPRPANARVISPKARVLRFDNTKLETLITWRDQLAGPASSFASDGLVVSEMLSDSEFPIDNDWVMALLCSPSFYDLPPENVQKIGQRMEPQPVKAGQRVIQQGEMGDYYYVIREGRARVLINEVTVAELEPLAAFGEQALASGAPRNASVEMITDGLLMRLSKEDFLELLAPNLINRVSLDSAKRMLKDGAILVDVRSPDEFAQRRLVRSINLPLFMLRRRLRKLDHNRSYIVYCDSGIRSAAGCFIMAQKGFKSYLLEDRERAFEEIPAKTR